MRLIDADALENQEICDYCEKKSHCFEYECFNLHEEQTVRNMIKQAPTIDAVPVVRCKDCKHFSGAMDQDGYVTAVGYCNHINHHIMPCRFDFYCADGERQEVQDELQKLWRSDWEISIDVQLLRNGYRTRTTTYPYRNVSAKAYNSPKQDCS